VKIAVAQIFYTFIRQKRKKAMRKKAIWRFHKSFMVLLVLFLMGCAGNGGPQISSDPMAPTTYQLLAGAGFKQIIPMNSDQRTQVLNLPQRQFFSVSKGPKVYYVYADASGCGCLYVGNPEQYRNFRSMLSQAQTAAEEYQAEVDGWDWNTWAPGWWGETGYFD
jgi:hypothetical protein